jgi:predicted small lipoprotein YifL
MLREFSAHPRIVASALVAAFLTLSLGACGIKGPLKLPPAASTPQSSTGTTASTPQPGTGTAASTPQPDAGTGASPAAPEKERAP